jgi:hypothetical protein
LPCKIIIFIIVYVFFNFAIALVWSFELMGYVMSTFFALFCTCALILAAVSILFLPPIIRRKIKERKEATSNELEEVSLLIHVFSYYFFTGRF